MNNTAQILSSLSSDLYRVATASHRQSEGMAKRFLLETHRWIDDLANKPVKPYMNKIIGQVNDLDKIKENDQLADTCLTYSILIRNYVTHFLQE